MKGKELRAVRGNLGLTQRQLAERMGVTGNSIARWERDEVPISILVARFVLLLEQDEQPSRRVTTKK